MEEWQVYPRIAAATALAAQDEGLTDTKRTRESLLDEATRKIRAAREHADALVSAGIISCPLHEHGRASRSASSVLRLP